MAIKLALCPHLECKKVHNIGDLRGMGLEGGVAFKRSGVVDLNSFVETYRELLARWIEAEAA